MGDGKVALPAKLNAKRRVLTVRYALKVRRLPVEVMMTLSGICARPLQCIGTMTSGSSLSSAGPIGMVSIAKELSSRGLRTSRGAQWHVVCANMLARANEHGALR
jgi:hypothetical protein